MASIVLTTVATASQAPTYYRGTHFYQPRARLTPSVLARHNVLNPPASRGPGSLAGRGYAPPSLRTRSIGPWDSASQVGARGYRPSRRTNLLSGYQGDSSTVGGQYRGFRPYRRPGQLRKRHLALAYGGLGLAGIGAGLGAWGLYEFVDESSQDKAERRERIRQREEKIALDWPSECDQNIAEDRRGNIPPNHECIAFHYDKDPCDDHCRFWCTQSRDVETDVRKLYEKPDDWILTPGAPVLCSVTDAALPEPDWAALPEPDWAALPEPYWGDRSWSTPPIGPSPLPRFTNTLTGLGGTTTY